MSEWNLEKAGSEPLEQLLYQSRLVGEREDLVLWGGGNNSVKAKGEDPLGQPLDVMLIKASGSDMRTMKAEQFTPLRLDYIRALESREGMADDEMVAYLYRCMLDPAKPRPSIETLLHGFLPFTAVLHTHADAILAVTNNRRREEAVRSCFGDRVATVPYLRPGFALSRMVAEVVRKSPGIEGVVLMNHGLITWGDDPREAYESHLRLVRMAEEFLSGTPVAGIEEASSAAESRLDLAARIAPILRGSLHLDDSRVLRYVDEPEVLAFVDRPDVEELVAHGAATPDHLLHTRLHPLFLDPGDRRDEESLRDIVASGLGAYWGRYRQYFDAHAQPGDEMLDPNPRVVLVRGVGLFTSGTSARKCRVVSDIYRHTIRIITAAESIGGYESLSTRDAFEAEYWPLELYKLTLAPKGKELSGHVALVTGAGRGIGRAIAQRFAREGCHVVVSDLDGSAAEAVAAEIRAELEPERAVAIELDVTDEVSVNAAFRRIALSYGGLDILVSNAGVARVGLIEELSLDDWSKSLSVNATGHFLVAREAVHLMKRQRTGGSLLFIATKNVPAPGKAFGAYSVAKAAEAQLCRILAIEGAEHGIRSNMLNPDAVFEGSGLWSETLRRERAEAYGISTEELPDFYRRRSLLGLAVTGEDVAEAALFLAGPRASKTTGAMLAVDAGLREAFPR